MKKKVLVTGGTGFLGSALVRQLVKEKYRVRVFDNDFRGSVKKLGDIQDKFEFAKGDIRDLPAVRKAIRGVDSVVQMAFINGTEFFYSIPEVVLDVGVKGIVNVIDGCVKEKIRDFIFVSSSEVYQNPPVIPTPEHVRMIIPDPLNSRYSYAGGKIIGELMTLNYGRKYFKRAIVIRPHNVYGPDMGWEHVIPQLVLRLKKLIEKQAHSRVPIRLPIQGTGRETRAFCYIDDFTRGLLTVFEKGEHLEIYNIGTQEETSILTLVKELSDYFHKKIVIIPGKLAKGGTPRRCPDISKIRQLGYKPRFSLSEGLAKTARWYLEYEEKK